MPIGAINTALETVKRLHAISQNVQHAEFRNLLADLSHQLADAKLENADLKEQIATLKGELLKLQQSTAPREKFKVVWGSYQFEGDPDNLYCPGCYETSGKKHITNRYSSRFRQCSVCQRMIAAG